MKVYYAHSIRIYDTEIEEKEYSFLREKYENVFNPNTEIEYKIEEGMKPYLDAVKASDLIIYLEFEGFVGKGVFREVELALINNIPVYCLRQDNGKFILLEVISVKLINENDPYVKYGRLEVKELNLKFFSIRGDKKLLYCFYLNILTE
ncbi:MAG: hypothetical protein ACTSQG_12020 [Promethearchaeota archaeon]